MGTCAFAVSVLYIHKLRRRLSARFNMGSEKSVINLEYCHTVISEKLAMCPRCECLLRHEMTYSLIGDRYLCVINTGRTCMFCQLERHQTRKLRGLKPDMYQNFVRTGLLVIKKSEIISDDSTNPKI